MEWLKRNYKTVVGGLIILILIEAVIAWYLIDQFRENYLSGEEALVTALEDLGIDRNDARDTDIDLETERGRAWYEIRIETSDAVHEYRIDAETGEILSARTK